MNKNSIPAFTDEDASDLRDQRIDLSRISLNKGFIT
jgi:hypothetical protein